MYHSTFLIYKKTTIKNNNLYLNIDKEPFIFNGLKNQDAINNIVTNERVKPIFKFISSIKEYNITIDKRNPTIQIITFAFKTLGLQYVAGKKHSGILL